jgi:hypothetical protein
MAGMSAGATDVAPVVARLIENVLKDWFIFLQILAPYLATQANFGANIAFDNTNNYDGVSKQVRMAAAPICEDAGLTTPIPGVFGMQINFF